MKAIAIRPGRPDSVHLRELPRPALHEVSHGRGVRVSIIRAGLCGTDADLAAGEYGVAPPGEDFLVLGHESLGWDEYAAAVATIGRAQTDEPTRGWLDELLTGRIKGFDAAAIARHLQGAGDHIKATVEIA